MFVKPPTRKYNYELNLINSNYESNLRDSIQEKNTETHQHIRDMSVGRQSKRSWYRIHAFNTNRSRCGGDIDSSILK